MTKAKWFYYPLFAALLLFVWCGSASAQVVYAPGGIGDVLIGDRYDLRDDPYGTGERTSAWENFIEIQNTSNQWVAVHLRFREAQDSLEVWDHPILLSPFDVFWAYMVQNADGQVNIISQDWDTLLNSGLISRADYLAENDYVGTFSPFLIAQQRGAAGITPDPDDYTAADWLRTQVGYVEVIGLFSFDGTAPDGYPDYEEYNDGLVHTLEWRRENPEGFGFIQRHTFQGDGLNASNIFDILRNVWGDAVNPGNSHPHVEAANRCINQREFELYSGDSNYLFGCIAIEDAPNALKGTIEMGEVITGQYVVNNMVALQNFRTDTTAEKRDETTWGPIVYPPELYLSGSFGGANQYPFVYTPYEENAYYLNPDWATAKGPTLRDGDDFTAVNQDEFTGVWSLDDVEIALAKSNIWSFYLNNKPFQDQWYETDVILTMPTKHLHFNHIDFPYWNQSIYRSGDLDLDKQDYLRDVRNYRSGASTADVRWSGRIWDTHEYSPTPYKEGSPDYTAWTNDWEFESFDFRISAVFDDNNTSITDYAMGQINIHTWRLRDADTWIGFTDGLLNNQLPVIGHTTRLHKYEGTDLPEMPFRSGSHPWQWTD